MHQLLKQLAAMPKQGRSLYALDDLRALLPDLSNNAFKTLMSRAVAGGHLERLCRGLYSAGQGDNGLLLCHAAAHLRSEGLNYISLESVLCDAGVISQMPIQRLMVMSSGRSSEMAIGHFGTIEFVHTRQTALALAPHLHYDARARLWRASVPQALRDMRATRRNMDLIDWEAAREFI